MRITKMQGVDLRVFDFDYDLTWAAFFMNADQHIYGRYGGRDEGHAEKSLSLKGLKYSMRQNLKAFQRHSNAKVQLLPRQVRYVEKFAAARRIKKGQCIHCHQVYDFRREMQVRQNKWTRDSIWVYPPPENIGLTLDAGQGDRVKIVRSESPASRAGLRPNDVIQTVNGMSVNSYGDVQYALHKAPAQGKIQATWERAGKNLTGAIDLPKGWRKSDISWRGSMWQLEPRAEVYGRDLTVDQKRKLGLSAKQLAFRQGNYVPPPSRRAGIRGGDIIIGADGKKLELSMLQFNVWVRLNYKNGNRITYNIIRNGRRMNVPMVLQSHYR